MTTTQCRHALNLLSSLQELRESEFICDFTINVNGDVFHVHRAIMAAVSKFFRAMFSSEMIEARKGSVDMHDMDAFAFKTCLEFIYTGETKITTENVKETLGVAHLLQLDDVVESCFLVLQDNLTSQNCLSAIAIAELYDRDGLRIIAEFILHEKFETVVETSEFASLSKTELLRYLKEYDPDCRITWKAVNTWFEANPEMINEHFQDVITAMNLQKFSFEFLFETLLKNSMVKNCRNARLLVLQQLFHLMATKHENYISIDNIYTVKGLSKEVNISAFIQNKVEFKLKEFMIDNFEILSHKDEFWDLTEKEVIEIFRSPLTTWSSEQAKWEAALKWVKNDHHREKVFPDLFRCINFGEFTPDFIQNIIRCEKLVGESHECKDFLLDATLRKNKTLHLKPKIDKGNHIVCIGKNSQKVQVLNVENFDWSNIGKVSGGDILGIVNIKDNIFVLGGRNLWRFEETGTWTKVSNIPAEISTFGQVVGFQDLIYLVSDKSMAVYNPTQTLWETAQPGCELDPEFCSTASEEFIYAMGGEGLECYSDQAKRFNPVTKKWERLSWMITGRACASAATLSNKIYVLGGINNSGTLNNAEIFDSTSRTWSEIRDMCSPRMWPATCVVNNILYAVGGSCYRQGEPHEIDSIECYREETRFWKIVKNFKPEGNMICCSSQCARSGSMKEQTEHWTKF